MLVTVNTDASYHHIHKVAAYAFWIVCNQAKIMHSGPLKEAQDCMDAEIMAIGNALYTLLHSRIINVTKIVINNDSLAAKAQVFKTISKEKLYRKCSLRVHEIIEQLRIKHERPKQKRIQIVFKHVKGHSGKDSPRKWVNDWCDTAAKNAMKELIKKKK